MGGRGIMMPLKAYCEKKGVQILMEHKVTDVYKNAQGRVIGARVEAGNKVINVRARKSEVLAGGNFKSNIVRHSIRQRWNSLPSSHLKQDLRFYCGQPSNSRLMWMIHLPLFVREYGHAKKWRHE